MTAESHKALLPAGLQDLLPPEAAHEAALLERLQSHFAAHGYERVKPPLIEFEDALLSGTGAAVANQTFRLMDPVSQRMMGLRADITTQVARIAASRLAAAPRPLRLCYAGQVLRVRGSQLRPERQFGEAGAELIGPDCEAADAEIILLACEALGAVVSAPLSVDLTMPTLVTQLAGTLEVASGQRGALRQALDRKDRNQVEQLAGGSAPVFLSLLSAAGPAKAGIEVLRGLKLPGAPRLGVERLAAVVDLVAAAGADCALTIDPVEHRGFEYQTGLSFTFFSKGVRGELGRGGRYVIEANGETAEPATGFTLYLDSVLRAAGAPDPQQRLFLPFGSDPARGKKLREEGWVTLNGLESNADPRAEAVSLGCSHILEGDAVEALPKKG